MASSQLLLSGAVVAAVYYLYSQGKKILQNNSSEQPPLDGLDPNWKGGAPINVDKPVDPHAGLPSCQIWDDDIQLFVQTSNPAWNKDAQTCFSNATSTTLTDPAGGSTPLLRYVDLQNNVSFNREDPLATSPAEAGVCYFTDENNGFYSFPGYAPVNASARLCFNAGDSIAQSGKMFYQSPAPQWINVRWHPNLDINDITSLLTTNPSFVWAVPSYFYGGAYTPPEVQPAAGQPYCEMEWGYNTHTSNNATFTGKFWLHNSESAAYDSDVNACTAAGMRYVDPTQNLIAYQNPETKTIVQRNLRDNL